MLEAVKPTKENCLQLCNDANAQYASFLAIPPKNELDIVDWRIKFNPLDVFDFPEELQQNQAVVLFKDYYSKSADYFYDLMEIHEKNNLTERVNISLATMPDLNLYHSFLTAVSPKEVSLIKLMMINEALQNQAYHSFYIDSSELFINVYDLSVNSISIFVAENGEVLFDKKSGVAIKGQLIVNSEQQMDFIEELIKEGVRVEVDRVG
jgi:predicted peroxiredoxin